MSTLKADTVTTKSDDTDLTIIGGGTGVPNLEAGFKVGGSAGVPTASIQDNAVTLAKIASGTDGELITWDASGDPAAVAVGTATHVLTSNGAGAAPTFQAAGGGATGLITRATFSTASTVDITGFSSGTYDSYEILMQCLKSDDNDGMQLRTSSNGGSSYDGGSSNYQYQAAKAEGGSTSNSGSTSATDIELSGGGLGAGANENMIIQLILNRPDDALFTNILWRLTGQNDTGNPKFISGGGFRAAASAVDAIQIRPSGGTITGSYIFIGYKNS